VKINILAAALLTILTASTQAAEKPLRILLVNDDGCQSVGTTSLQEKLAAKGYDVWMVAPDQPERHRLSDNLQTG
jgi:5'-nucleotidase